MGEHGHVHLHKDFAATNHQNDIYQVLAMDEYQSALNIIQDRSGKSIAKFDLLMRTANNTAGADLKKRLPIILHPPILGSPQQRLAPIIIEA